MKRTKIKELFLLDELDVEVMVQGWVKTKRSGKKYSFIELNDGSTVRNLQIVLDNSSMDPEVLKNISTGAAVGISGVVSASPKAEQPIEMQAQKVTLYGAADADTYPLQKKAHSLEFLRELAHLRFRTATFGSIFRIRNALAYAIHKYFFEKGFVYLHTPIITGSDCEGAGEMFQVTTLPLAEIPRTEEGGIDFHLDFFEKPAHLTVSGQLNAELAALGLSEVYTFGPTFRAENSNTSRHLAEFWMIEPEMAFYDLDANMHLAEDFLKYLVRFALEHCTWDLEALTKYHADQAQEGETPAGRSAAQPLNLIERLEHILESDFIRLDYSEGIEILSESGRNFEYPIKWGSDLQSEHERYLVENHFGKPVILINYPREIKAFYMRLNEDGKTVAAMDILFPGIGEIIGGSQREERLDVLLEQLKAFELNEDDYHWYLDTRKFGSAPHSGFGLGFERLLLFVTGMSNIRDVIPFPRTPGHAEF